MADPDDPGDCLGGTELFFLQAFRPLCPPLGGQNKTRFDKIPLDAFHGPLFPFLLLMGTRVILDAVPLTGKMARLGEVVTSLAAAFVVILAGIKFCGGVLNEYGQGYEPIKPSLGILNLLGKALIALIGLLITLDSLSNSITPLLTSLGIGGLAVALAFKGHPGQFFCGPLCPGRPPHPRWGFREN
jgi:small-conductance mechanosensitive channel